jgi:hypothetical protein
MTVVADERDVARVGDAGGGGGEGYVAISNTLAHMINYRRDQPISTHPG